MFPCAWRQSGQVARQSLCRLSELIFLNISRPHRWVISQNVLRIHCVPLNHTFQIHGFQDGSNKSPSTCNFFIMIVAVSPKCQVFTSEDEQTPLFCHVFQLISSFFDSWSYRIFFGCGNNKLPNNLPGDPCFPSASTPCPKKAPQHFPHS